jgi:hypothetical protein
MIKDIDVHIGLADKELRDYFSSSLSDLYASEMESANAIQKKTLNYYQTHPRNEVSHYFVNGIAINEINLEHHLNKLAVFTLMQSKGWTEHDISDFTVKTGNNFLSFIGTEKEYEDFLPK